MALAKVEILGGSRGADAISGTLASGTNILQDSLSEAVRSGRAMADLQQGQERDLLGERESLRNFHEKKRGEEQRILESTRDFEEKQYVFDETIKREDERIQLGKDDLTLKERGLDDVSIPDSLYGRRIFDADTNTWTGGNAAQQVVNDSANLLNQRINRAPNEDWDPTRVRDWEWKSYPSGSMPPLLPLEKRPGYDPILGDVDPDFDFRHDEITPDNPGDPPTLWRPEWIDDELETEYTPIDLSGVDDINTIELSMAKMTPEQLRRDGPALRQRMEELRAQQIRRATPSLKSALLNPGTVPVGGAAGLGSGTSGAPE